VGEALDVFVGGGAEEDGTQFSDASSEGVAGAAGVVAGEAAFAVALGEVV
jgi:hypothetical protein